MFRVEMKALRRPEEYFCILYVMESRSIYRPTTAANTIVQSISTASFVSELVKRFHQSLADIMLTAVWLVAAKIGANTPYTEVQSMFVKSV